MRSIARHHRKANEGVNKNCSVGRGTSSFTLKKLLKKNGIAFSKIRKSVTFKDNAKINPATIEQLSKLNTKVKIARIDNTLSGKRSAVELHFKDVMAVLKHVNRIGDSGIHLSSYFDPNSVNQYGANPPTMGGIFICASFAEVRILDRLFPNHVFYDELGKGYRINHDTAEFEECGENYNTPPSFARNVRTEQ